MNRYRFAIIGSGWRAAYYIRIAQALPKIFELCAVYCRSEEKARKIRKEFGVNAVTSEEECIALKPDFVVVAVSKKSGAEVAVRWLDRDFTVLSETPAGTDLTSLAAVRERSRAGKKHVVAEQYTRYPQHSALLKIIKTGIIGETSCLNLSMAHDYHGASLIRAFLDIPEGTGFSVCSRSHLFPTVLTRTRYEEFSDGRVADRMRRMAIFEFENGKTAFYDFDSEQYRSPIRKNTLKLQGVRGEVIDDSVYYLDSEYKACRDEIQTSLRTVDTGNENINLRYVDEIEKITFRGEVMYEPPFGLCGLSEDETAIALLMKGTGDYSRGEGDSPYPIEDALCDSYMAIMMQESEDLKMQVDSNLFS